jgi:hypothetical protein
MNSASLCSLAGRYDNPIPTRCLAPIGSLKIPALLTSSCEGSPGGREGSPRGSEGSPRGPEGSPRGREGSPRGREGSPRGREGSPRGREGSHVSLGSSFLTV